ncbi:hypothetical protein NQ318_001210 [Aromia moschata]|uniref:Ubiquinone biosynthesis O-methyltransferase, mitochondrial n=1 Tax=Aromia moschata TaxID=1265417 RepID=A0AAV8ZFU4_9CUCU|nr:hypothetical protein NQ318_001210 [Aromia moschata]
MFKKTIISCLNYRGTATASSTIDNVEVQHFEKFLSEWWNVFGPMKPLHAMNKLRVSFIRDGLVNAGTIDPKNNSSEALKDLCILDIGCGGGILAEPLTRLGGSVTGIDANSKLVDLAKSHADLNSLKIKYLATSVEQHAAENVEKYDAVVASEVLEHVGEKETFLEACVKCLKPTGSIFVTTVNKTTLAEVGIFFSEYVLNLLPKGTHQIEKCVEPVKLQRILEDNNCRSELIHGMYYNGVTNTWHWCSDTSINYALHAIKLKVSE